jgi:hypothetical protein
MMRKELVALYGRIGLMMAAFGFVAAIVVGPLLLKAWPPRMEVTAQRDAPTLRPQNVNLGPG